MLFEFLYEMFNDFSPIYMYVSVFISVMCTYQIMHVDMHHFLYDSNAYTREQHMYKPQVAPVEEISGEILDIQNWLAKKTMLVASPNDDTEHHPHSFFTNKHIKRGGQKWKIILDSLSLRNIT